MPTSLTATKIKDTYGQLLHVDGGVTSTPKTVYDGDGTATALKIGTGDVQVNNSSVLTDADASSFATAAQGSKADTAVQPAAIANMLETSDIGVTVQGYDSTILKSSAIGVTVQEYDADLTTWSGKTAPTGAVVGTSDSQTLTNKTISGASNTLSNIGNSSLTNSAVTIGSTSISLGATASSIAGLMLTGAAVNGTVGATTPATGAFTDFSSSGTVTVSGGTANGVAYLNGSKVLTTGSALTYDGTTFTSGSHTIASGNLTFTGTGNRITGDFSNATIANRVMFQTSTANSATSISAIPNGTNTQSDFFAFNASDTTNASLLLVRATAAETTIRSGITGTGTYLPMTFYNGGSERMRLDTSGNLMVGIASTGYRMQVNGNADTTFALASNAGSNGAALIRLFGSDASTFSAYNAIVSLGNAGGQQWYIGGDGNINTLVFKTSTTERMRIDSSGNVGIGTSSPGAKLDIKGLARSSIGTGTGAGGAGYAFYQFGTSATATENWHIGAEGDGSFRFYNQGFGAGIERMRIDSSGNLLVGTTAPLNGALLTVQNAGGSGLAVGYGTTAGQWRRVYISTADQGLYFYNGNNEGYLNSAGAWTNASDARLKKEIVDIKYGISAVMQTQPRSYKMNDVDGRYIGFIAQELQQVIPEVVSGDPERQLGVDYGSLVAVAFKAIQELKAELDATKAEVAALKGA